MATTLDLDFTLATTLDPRITFSRTSLGTYYDSAGVLKYAAHNLLFQSQTFNTGWTFINGATVTADATIAPDGTTTADRLNHVTAGTVGGGYANQTGIAGAIDRFIFSCYVKAGSKSWVVLGGGTAAGANGCFFNLATGVLGTKGGAWVSSAIENIGNGWYRCSILGTVASAGGGSLTVRVAETNASDNCTSPGDIFIWGAQSENVTTATTPSTYLPTTTAAVHTARFDYDPVTHLARGLLIEEQRTNGIGAPTQDFTHASWTKTGVTVTADQLTALDGTTTADLITASATTATIGVSGSAPGNYVASVFAKKGTSDWMYMIGQATDVPRAWFNINTGTVGTIEAGLLGASIENVGNGWWRCVLRDVTGTGNETVTVGLCDADNSATVTVGRTVYLWGAQLEGSGDFPTSYLPTLGTIVTRAADVAVMTGSNFSSWYNQPAGTFVVEYVLLSEAVGGAAGIRGLISADGGTVNESVRMLYSTTPMLGFSVVDGGTSQATLNHSPPTPLANATHKFGASSQVNDFASCVDGGTVLTDVVGTMPTPTQLRIGVDEASHYLSGYVRRIQFQNVKVDNATLQTLPQPPTGTPLEPQPPAVGPTTTGGSAFWDEFDDREYESSRKRRKRFLEERARRIAEL